jgi:hypothetical protein
MKKIITILLCSIFFLTSFSAFAQEDLESEAENMIESDEGFSEEELGVGKQRILPGSPFYFLKDWRRGIQDFFTFDPVKDAELKLRFANERMAEIREMVKEGRPQEDIEETLDKYNEEFEEMRKRVEEKLSESEDPKADEFLGKLIKYSLVHHKMADAIEKEIPNIEGKLEQVRERIIENFASSSIEIGSGEKIRERLEEEMNEVKGSELKHIKNLEVLMKVEEKVPEQAKEAIRNAQSNIFKRLKDNLDAIPEDEKGIMEKYMEKVQGNESMHLEIISEIENNEISSKTRDALENAKNEVIERIKEKTEDLSEEQIEKYLGHLGQGVIRKVLVAEEIEKNVSSEAKEYVSRIRERAEEKIIERINEAETEEEKEEILKEAEESPSLKSLNFLERFQENAGSAEPLLQEMKERITERIKEGVESAQGEEERVRKMEAFSGGSQETLDALEKSTLPQEVKTQLREVEQNKIMNNSPNK